MSQAPFCQHGGAERGLFCEDCHPKPKLPPDPSFAEIEKVLRGLPQTWYPALVKIICEEAMKADVFKPGGLTQFVKQFDEKFVGMDFRLAIDGQTVSTIIYCGDKSFEEARDAFQKFRAEMDRTLAEDWKCPAYFMKGAKEES